MKASFALIVPAFLLFTACGAQQQGQSSNVADFSTDEHGAVTCKGNNVKVKIDAARKVITIIDAYDPGHPETYKVWNQGGDGDTMVEYTAKNSEGEDVALGFSDQGDYLIYKGSQPTQVPLTCPK